MTEHLLIWGIDVGDIASLAAVLAALWAVFYRAVVHPILHLHKWQQETDRKLEALSDKMDAFCSSTDERLGAMQEQVDYTAGQMRTNGGSTVLDAVYRVEAMVASLTGTQGSEGNG